MMRWILLAVAVVALSTAATVAVQNLPTASSSGPEVPFPAADPTGPQPVVRVDGDTTHHFGTLPQRSKGSHTWSFHNDGAGDLQLTMVSSTCSCTVANLANGKTATVKPGDATEVELSWETRENNGEYSKSATIGTNDPKHPTITLITQGEVRPAVVVYPSLNIDYQEISTDDKDHKYQIAVYSPDKEDFAIEKIKTSRPGVVTADIEPMTADDLKHFKVKAGFRVNLDVKAGLPLGPFREEAVLSTNHPLQPDTTLAITGRMVGPVTVIPQTLRLRDVHSRLGGRGEVTLIVRGRRVTKFAVEKTPANLQADVTPAVDVATSGKYTLAVTVPPGTAAGQLQGTVVLRSDHPEAAELKVPVNIYIDSE